MADSVAAVPGAADSTGSGLLLRGRRALLPDGQDGPGWVHVDGDRVVAVGRDDETAPTGVHAIDVPVLAPGFVDLHCHGGAGSSFTDEDLARVAAAADAHRRHGTTTSLASLVTASVDTLEGQVRALRELVADDVLAGVHLEGPWLSPRFAGAHDPALLRPPERADVVRLLVAGGGDVRMVTVAPELEHGLDAVRLLAGEGVVAAVGHTDADADLTRRAVDAGARVMTHLFNAMRPLHHRAPGPVAAALADERVVVELVADGVHVHPDVLLLAARSTRGGFALVTDAMAAACAQDGAYRLGGLDVDVRDGVARLAGSGAIAGSTLTADAAVRCAVAAGLPLADAVRGATATPARVLGLADRGHLGPGARADVACLDDDLQVVAVLRHGSWVAGDARPA